MNNFNKVLSFILGLVVVIIFFAVLTGRINLKNKIPLLSAKVSPTPTPKPETDPTPVSVSSITISDTSSAQSTNSYNRYQTSTKKTSTKTPSTIPSTGSPTLLLPLFFSTLGVGIYLKKKA